MKLLVPLVLLLAGAPLAAQTTPAPDSTGRFDFGFRFAFAFHPDRVLRQGQLVDLEKAQNARIKAEIDLATAGLSTLKRQLQERQHALDLLLEQPQVSEAAALRALDAVMLLESELKRTRLTLLIRTKNTLTPEQQERLLKTRRTGQ